MQLVEHAVYSVLDLFAGTEQAVVNSLKELDRRRLRHGVDIRVPHEVAQDLRRASP